MRSLIENYWYRDSLNLFTFLLLPLSFLFRILITLRKWLYKIGVFKTYEAPLPVIVVGNITVGGTGKTPFVIWLAQFLKDKGYRPGIVSRGVGGRNHQVHLVNANDSAEKVGDEALLLLKRTKCPLAIAIDRIAAVKYLLTHTDCNIIISDDGLQRYSLGRDIEIAVIDGMRKFGNKKLLPAGPLREPISRLKAINFQLVNNTEPQNGQYKININYIDVVNLKNETKTQPLRAFSEVHAVAAIGNPQRFYNFLLNADLELHTHTYLDHYLYRKSDFNFKDELPIIMTEKDAVKCKNFADDKYWYLPIDVSMSKQFEIALNQQLETIHESKKILKPNHISAISSTNLRTEQ